MNNKQKSANKGKQQIPKPKSKPQKKKQPASPPASSLSYAPVAQGSVMITKKPSLSTSVMRNGDGSIRIRHREYIGDVTGTTVYGVSSFAVNPGVATSFPWLSTLGFNYETYLFRGLRFEYEPQCSTATPGSVMLAIDYDASDAAPVNKQQIMSYMGAVRAAPWQGCCFQADPLDLAKYSRRYIRAGALGANQDIKTYDVGQLFVATQAGTAIAWGELYVVYDVEFQTPQADLSGAISAFSAKMVSTSTTLTSPLNGATITGQYPVLASGSNVFMNRSGKFLVELELVGTVFTGAAPSNSASTATVVSVSYIVNSAATAATHVLLITVNSAGQTWNENLTGVATTLTGCTARISAYDTALA